mmetsp:Transcript_42335/g.92065  ORF Transcript_42335/g.92065 Transcript_42335/m.92065 type:complete len:303 (-) Transcript_42335:352-1260(-)
MWLWRSRITRAASAGELHGMASVLAPLRGVWVWRSTAAPAGSTPVNPPYVADQCILIAPARCGSTSITRLSVMISRPVATETASSTRSRLGPAPGSERRSLETAARSSWVTVMSAASSLSINTASSSASSASMVRRAAPVGRCRGWRTRLAWTMPLPGSAWLRIPSMVWEARSNAPATGLKTRPRTPFAVPSTAPDNPASAAPRIGWSTTPVTPDHTPRANDRTPLAIPARTLSGRTVCCSCLRRLYTSSMASAANPPATCPVILDAVLATPCVEADTSLPVPLISPFPKASGPWVKPCIGS